MQLLWGWNLEGVYPSIAVSPVILNPRPRRSAQSALSMLRTQSLTPVQTMPSVILKDFSWRWGMTWISPFTVEHMLMLTQRFWTLPPTTSSHRIGWSYGWKQTLSFWGAGMETRVKMLKLSGLFTDKATRNMKYLGITTTDCPMWCRFASMEMKVGQWREPTTWFCQLRVLWGQLRIQPCIALVKDSWVRDHQSHLTIPMWIFRKLIQICWKELARWLQISKDTPTYLDGWSLVLGAGFTRSTPTSSMSCCPFLLGTWRSYSMMVWLWTMAKHFLVPALLSKEIWISMPRSWDWRDVTVMLVQNRISSYVICATQGMWTTNSRITEKHRDGWTHSMRPAHGTKATHQASPPYLSTTQHLRGFLLAIYFTLSNVG